MQRRALPILPSGALQHDPSPTDGEKEALPIAVLEQEAAALGFSAVRVTSAERLAEDGERLQNWLTSGYQASMHYLAGPGRDEPHRLLSCVRSIVTVALDCQAPHHTLPSPGDKPRGRIAGYAVGPDYHSLLKERLRELSDRLAGRLGRPIVALPCVDTAPVLERGLAERSGLGFVGKNTLLIVPGLGSKVLLGEVLLDLELPSSTPTRKRCGRCTACLDACPTGAFVGPYLVDARRCISYLTIEHRGGIPRELRPKVGDWVFGCDLCQNVCPWNRGGKRGRRTEALAGTQRLSPCGLSSLGLIALLEQRSGDYKRLVKGTALRRASRNQLARNAAVALGNSGSIAAVAPLCRTLAAHPSAIVRGHAAWALGELRASAARAPLELAAAKDTDPTAREECSAALACLKRESRCL